MKIISLLQPWATLVVIGAKKIDTRGWNTNHRGPLGIHASTKMDRRQKELARSEPFWSVLRDLDELPLGAIIGAVDIQETFWTQDADPWIRTAWIKFLDPGGKMSEEALAGPVEAAVAAEKAFGNYTPDRTAWLLENHRIFLNPIRIRGARGIWDFRICRVCGCWDQDCRHCIEKTGHPCHWVAEDLCSACV